MSSKRNAWLKIKARPSDHASSGWMKFKGYPGCRTPYIRCTKRARCFPSSDIISLLQDIVGVTISKAFVLEVARNCDEKVILQIIYTALGSELPVGPAHARVSTATSPLSASIAPLSFAIMSLLWLFVPWIVVEPPTSLWKGEGQVWLA